MTIEQTDGLMDVDEARSFIRSYCDFSDKRAYVLMAIARGNDENPHLSNSDEIVFREVVKNEKDIDRKIDKLQNSTEHYTGDEDREHTFRLYISANARNVVDAYWMLQNEMADWGKQAMNGAEGAITKLNRIDSQWKSIMQKPGSKDETHFVWDFDDPTIDMADVVSHLSMHTNVVACIPTPNGYHVITKPFDESDAKDGASTSFTDSLEDVKYDGMTFLCYLTR